MAKHQVHDHTGGALEDTVRIETFSDGVYAIVATLLVLELRVPEIPIKDTAHFLSALLSILPQITAFTFSFFIVAVYWVNHHHFFHSIEKTDWRLMWYNNFHLFWVATIPFTTAFIGSDYNAFVPVFVYVLDMTMAASSIMLMIHYVFFRSHLMYEHFPLRRKKSEFKRGCFGIYFYAFSAIACFINVYIALAVFVIVPFFFVVPQVLGNNEVEV